MEDEEEFTDEDSYNAMLVRHNKEIRDFEKRCDHRRIRIHKPGRSSYDSSEDGISELHIDCSICHMALAHFKDGKFTYVYGWKEDTAAQGAKGKKD